MRRGFGILGLVVTAIVLVLVGVVAYNIGWQDGVNTHVPAVSGGGAPYYYYGPHFWGAGFGIFGLFWFLLILFGIFWLFRMAFWGFAGRRMWGYRGGWYGHGHGMPPAIDERMQEWHRRAHGEQPPAQGSGTTPPPPPPDSRSV